MKKLVLFFAILASVALPVSAQNTSTFGTINASASICTARSCVYYQPALNTPWVVVNVAGTWSGTIQIFAVNSPNATYQNLNSQTWIPLSTITANGNWSVAVGSAYFILVQAQSWASGSANVTMASSANGSPLTNPVFSGQLTGNGLAAPTGGSPSDCWPTNGGSGVACGGGGSGQVLQMQVVPPVTGQYVVVYPTLDSPAATGQGAASSGETSGAMSTGILYGPSAEGGTAQVEWSLPSLPSYVSPSNVTAVYAFATVQTILSTPPSSSLGVCGPGDWVYNNNFLYGVTATASGLGTFTLLGSGYDQIGPAQYNAVMTGLTGANFGTATIAAEINSTGDCLGAANLLANVGFIVYYTGTAPPAQTAINIVPPLYYDPAIPALSISSNAQFPGTALIPTTVQHLLPAGSVSGWIQGVTDGTSSTDCTTGGGSTYLQCKSNGTIWSAYSSGGSSISLTTTGTSGAATLSGTALNIPQYQGALTLSTTGSSGAATLSGNTLNIPQYSGGGSGGYTNVTGSASETTVAQINTACGSGTYYATTALSIATGGTVACRVQFSKAGLWTIASGQTVTFTYPIRETDGPAQHFAGSGTVALASTQASAYPEWWGAVNDWNGTTGTDDTAAIQAGINALPLGIEWLASGGCYKISSALSITKNGVGLQGFQLGGYVNPYDLASSQTPSSCLVTTSATIDFIDMAGSNTARLTGNVLKNIALQRTVAPTGTAAGFNLQYTCGAWVDNTTSADSIYNYYLKGVSSCGLHGVTHSFASHGFSGFTYSGGPYYDWYLDTSGGATQNTVVLNWDGGASNGIASTYCAALYGSFNVDENLQNMNCWKEDYGVDINTSSGGTTQDVHIDSPTLDGMTVASFRITESGGLQGPVTVSGGDGWMNTQSGADYGVDCESASNLTISGVQFFKAGQTGSTLASIYANGCSGLSIVGNQFYPITGSNGIWFNNTNNSTIQGNVVYGASGVGTGYVFKGSSGNMFQGNTLYGSLIVGASFDSTSNNNTSWQLDNLTAATTPVSDSGSGNGSFATDGAGTTTTPEFAESSTTLHLLRYRTPSQALGDMGAVGISGTPTTGHCAQWASATTIVDAGSACGSSSGGITLENGGSSLGTVTTLNCSTGTTCTATGGTGTITASGGGSSDYASLLPSITATGCTITGSVCAVSGSAVASITFASVPSGYQNAVLNCSGWVTNSSTAAVEPIDVSLNGDTTSGHYLQAQLFQWYGTTDAAVGNGPTTAAEVGLLDTTGNSAYPGNMKIEFPLYTNASVNKEIIGHSRSYNTVQSTKMQAWETHSYWTGTPAAITSINIAADSGNTIAVGTSCTLAGMN